MRGVRAVVSAVALVVGVVACSVEPEAAPAPSPSASSASSTSEAPVVEPSPTTEAFTKPVLPEAATTPDAAGAEAFVRHFWDTVNYAYASGDTAAILEISEAGCQGCVGLKDGVESATSVGWRWQNYEWQTEQYLAGAPDEAGLSSVSGLMVLASDPHIVGPDGRRGEVEGARAKAFETLAQWRDGRWIAFAVSYSGEE